MAADAVIKEWLDSLGIATEQEVRATIGLGALSNLAWQLATAQPQDRPGVVSGWVGGLGGTARTLVRHRLGTASMLTLVNALVKVKSEAAFSERAVIAREKRWIMPHAVTDGGTIEPIYALHVGPDHVAAIREVMAEQGSVYVHLDIRVMDPSKMDVLGADEPASAEASTSESAGPTPPMPECVAEAHAKDPSADWPTVVARIVDAKLEAFKREQADAIGPAIAEQWAAVLASVTVERPQP